MARRVPSCLGGGGDVGPTAPVERWVNVNEAGEDPGAWLEALRRNSGLALDPEGRWRYGTGFVENERVAELFHAGLAVRPDGEVTLTVGKMWAYVKCEGPAFFVRSVRGREVALLGGGTRSLGVDAVFGWGPDERLYLWVGGQPPAKVLRTPHQALVAGVYEVGDVGEVDETDVGSGSGSGRLVCRVGDLEIPVVKLAERPGPNTPRPAS